MAPDTTVDLKYKGKTYQLNYKTLTVEESCQLQLATGYTPAMILADFSRGGVFGVFGLLLVALRRSGMRITWEDLQKDEVFAIATDDEMTIPEEHATDPSEAPSPAPQAKPPARKRSAKK